MTSTSKRQMSDVRHQTTYIRSQVSKCKKSEIRMSGFQIQEIELSNV